MTLIHIHDEPQQDMDSCNITGIEGQKQQTKQLQKGKEMENTLEFLFDIPNSWIRMGHRWNSEFYCLINLVVSRKNSLFNQMRSEQLTVYLKVY